MGAASSSAAIGSSQLPALATMAGQQRSPSLASAFTPYLMHSNDCITTRTHHG